MSRNSHTICSKGSGFTVVELLMALAISAMLLAAAAVAISVSSQTISVNDSVEQISHTGRMVLGRMARELRNCDDVKVTGGTLLHIVYPSGNSVAWAEYEMVNSQIIYRQNDGSSTNNYVLLGAEDGISVTSLSFTPASLDTASGSAGAVNVQLVLSGSGESVKLSSSSWPRRHLAW